MEFLSLPTKSKVHIKFHLALALQGIFMMANPSSSLSYWGLRAGRAAAFSNLFNMNPTILTALLSLPMSQIQQEEHREQALP